MKAMSLLILFASSLMVAQVPPNEFYCNIKDTKVEAQIGYNPSTGIYTYSYSIYSGASNSGKIGAIRINISTKSKNNPIDSDLLDNCSDVNDPHLGALARKMRSEYAIPVGMTNPTGSKDCGASKRLDAAGNDIGAYAGLGFPYIEPGGSVTNLVIKAKFPPGLREFEINPNWTRCYGHIPMTDVQWDVLIGEDGTVEGYTRPKGFGKDEDWILYGKTVGPVEPTDYSFYNGGGQKPDDVNLFLKYANPLVKETTLPSGTNQFDLIVYYGPSILPATFYAELNGADITTQFQPIAGVPEAKKLNLQPGRNNLLIRVDGKNSKGQSATDTDRLIFVVQ